MKKTPVLDTQNVCDTAELLKTPSGASRLQIIRLLCKKGALSVGEIADQLSLEQSATSHQLAKLRAEEIVTSNRSGQVITYQLAKNAKAKLTQDIIKQCGCLNNN